jgi:hypothetical protein
MARARGKSDRCRLLSMFGMSELPNRWIVEHHLTVHIHFAARWRRRWTDEHHVSRHHRLRSDQRCRRDETPQAKMNSATVHAGGGGARVSDSNRSQYRRSIQHYLRAEMKPSVLLALIPFVAAILSLVAGLGL